MSPFRFATASTILTASVLTLALSLPQAWAAPQPPPPGRIHYQTWRSGVGTLGCFSMNADGSGTLSSECGYPTRQVHSARRWFLTRQAVAGSYPNTGTGGYPPGRAELFAVRDDAGAQVQLTNDAHVQIDTAFRWAFDDASITFAAVTWTAVQSGGNYTDGSGQQWLADAAMFRMPVDWSTGTPNGGTPVAVLDTELYFETAGAEDAFYARPAIVALDRSPAGNQVAYGHVSNSCGGCAETFVVRVATFAAGGGVSEITVGPGRRPDWAPNGSRIAYDRYDTQGTVAGIFTVLPSGSSIFQVTNGIDRTAHWSPDSAHLTFERAFSNRQRGGGGSSTVFTYDVMRVPAGGGSATNLTKTIDDNATPTAWR